ncbi:MAG: hypothetical protein QGH83_06360 [Candidatus Pacebacteria bacterium]|nr:hypothetical protein [Candidatus Paceibacterota bacterium]
MTINIDSFSIDLNRADSITWLVNNEVVSRGAGVKQMQFEAGKLGSRSVIDVVVRGTDIGTVTESITIAPTEVDLLWEAKTYTPPFYSGKALPSSDAEITITAIPQFVTSNGNKLKSSELIFTWKRDGKVLGKDSGRGRDTIEITGPRIFNSTLIQVKVSSLGGTLHGKGFAQIFTVQPKIIFYKNDIILGMRYEKGIKDTLTLSEEEVNITAHPYFFSGNRRVSSDFDYNWNVDGSSVPSSPDDESSIVLRQIGEGEGSAVVTLSIQSIDKILQVARESFSVIFGTGKDTLFNF